MKLSYSSITQNTLDQLVALSAWLVSWGPWETNRKIVQERLGRVQKDIKHIAKISQHFVDSGNKEYDLRAEQISRIHIQIGAIYENEQRVTKDLNELAAKLTSLKTSRQLTEKAVADTRRKLAENIASLAERKAKLEELQKWFWVPGYGQYVTVRSLVDNDLQASLSLANSVADIERKLQNTTASLNEIPQIEARLNAQKANYETEKSSLEAFRGELNDSLGRLKKVLVFFGDVATFWGELKVLSEDELQFTVEALQRKLALLERKEKLPAFTGDQYFQGLQRLNSGEHVLTLSLREGILRLAAVMDERKDWKQLTTPGNGVGPQDEHYEFVVPAGSGKIFKIDWDGCVDNFLPISTSSSGGSYRSLGVAGDRLFVSHWGGWPMAMFSRHGDFTQPYKLDGAWNDFFPLPDGRLVRFTSHYGIIEVLDLKGKLHGKLCYNRDPKDPNRFRLQGPTMKMTAVMVDNHLIVCHNGNKQLLRIDLTETPTYEYDWSVFRDLSQLGKEPAYIAYTSKRFFVSAGEDLFSFTADPSSEVKRWATFPGAPITGLAAAENTPLFVLTGRSLYELDSSGKICRTVAVHDGFTQASNLMMVA